MGSPTLIKLEFGLNQVHFRVHWGGAAAVMGNRVLDLLELALSRRDARTQPGAILLRMLTGAEEMDEIDWPPTTIWDEFIGEVNGTQWYGDWETAYILRCEADGLPWYDPAKGCSWSIGYVKRCRGEFGTELEGMATWYSPDNFQNVASRAVSKAMRNGQDVNVSCTGRRP